MRRLEPADQREIIGEVQQCAHPVRISPSHFAHPHIGALQLARVLAELQQDIGMQQGQGEGDTSSNRPHTRTRAAMSVATEAIMGGSTSSFEANEILANTSLSGDVAEGCVGAKTATSTGNIAIDSTVPTSPAVKSATIYDQLYNTEPRGQAATAWAPLCQRADQRHAQHSQGTAIGSDCVARERAGFESHSTLKNLCGSMIECAHCQRRLPPRKYAVHLRGCRPAPPQILTDSSVGRVSAARQSVRALAEALGRIPASPGRKFNADEQAGCCVGNVVPSVSLQPPAPRNQKNSAQACERGTFATGRCATMAIHAQVDYISCIPDELKVLILR